MHEWALAKGVISTALKVAGEKNAKRILEIRIKVGELQQTDRGVLKFAMKKIAKGTKAENSKMVVEPERAVFSCNFCGRDWSFDHEGLKPDEVESIHFVPEVAHVYVRCPSCGSPDFQIKEGRGVLLDFVRMEDGP